MKHLIISLVSIFFFLVMQGCSTKDENGIKLPDRIDQTVIKKKQFSYELGGKEPCSAITEERTRSARSINKDVNYIDSSTTFFSFNTKALLIYEKCVDSDIDYYKVDNYLFDCYDLYNINQDVKDCLEDDSSILVNPFSKYR